MVLALQWGVSQAWCAMGVRQAKIAQDTILQIAERCSCINAKPSSVLVVKALFCKLTNSLQQIVDNARAFPALFLHKILTFVSNCKNLHNALPSFSKDSCTHTVNLVPRLDRRLNNFTPQIRAHKIHFSYVKCKRMTMASNPTNPHSVSFYL